jgi:hypothetical protein
MTGDETARAFDRLLADFLEAAARRDALGSLLPKGGKKAAHGTALVPWFASKEGRSRVKKILAALKAERGALKSLAKFSRKMVNINDAAKSEIASADTTLIQLASSPSAKDRRTPNEAPGAEGKRPRAMTEKVSAKPRASRTKRASPSAKSTVRAATVRGSRRQDGA